MCARRSARSALPGAGACVWLADCRESADRQTTVTCRWCGERLSAGDTHPPAPRTAPHRTDTLLRGLLLLVPGDQRDDLIRALAARGLDFDLVTLGLVHHRPPDRRGQ